MRIAAVTCVYPPYRGGIGSAAQRQAELLAELGHEVDVYCPAQEGAASHELDGAVRVHRLASPVRYGNSAFLPQLATRVAAADALYLHFPFYGGAEAAAAGAVVRRRPLVAYFHMDVVGTGARGAFLSAYERTVAPLVLRRARYVLVSSLDYARHSSLARHGLRRDRVVAQPYGTDTRVYRPGPAEPEALGRLGIDPSRPFVLFVGGMDAPHAFKGVPQLLEAFAIAGLATDAQLVLVGEGELRPGYQEHARALGLEGVVRFLGRTPEDDLVRLYRATSVTALPSTTREEAFGLVLTESMACGSPVVASALPGVREVVGDGEDAAGIGVPAGDVPALAAALGRVVREPDLRSLLSRRAAAAVEERYSRDVERATLDRVFSSL
jgi:glycosyltransferase involved in cell wall biosynthesis